MLAYVGLKSGFIHDVDINEITQKIYDRFKEVYHRGVGQSEINSWTESMLRMRGVLADNDIPDNAGVAIEFNIPHTSNRIDFLISGYDENKNNSIIIIELKQWSTSKVIEGKEHTLGIRYRNGDGESPHPSYQAWSYASLINAFNQDVYDNDSIKLYPCAFLHNYDLKQDDPIYDDKFSPWIKEAPMFGSKDFEKLSIFIKKYITEGDNQQGLYIIENGKIRPSKMLQDSFDKVIDRSHKNNEFVLIDDQILVYDEALSLGVNTFLNDEKSVLIVEGGPGTGKSVVAINLLRAFLDRDRNSFYITKNSAPRNVFKSKLKIDHLSGLNNLFKSSGSFVDSDKDTFDVLIVDEAHRLNAKTFNGRFLCGENQIKEIINAAKFSIFFIDENQKVTLDDIGTIELIKKYAKEAGAGIKLMELKSQFRCDGSDGYIAWLNNALEIKDTANYNLEEINYDINVYDNPNDLKDAIIEKNRSNNKSRIVAGYCWEWPKPTRNDAGIKHVSIPEYNFGMSWNFANTDTWAIDEKSVEECGCIHTCQGLEFDYVGVIIGDDMRYENGHIVTDYTKRAKTDQSLKGINKIAKEDGQEVANKIADEIIKNTYRTLMTRGMKGCYIYCSNKELSDYIKSNI